jgi:hypothetical protein
MKKFLSLVLAITFITVQAQAQIKLGYDLSKTTEYSTKITLDQIISQTAMGQTQNIDSGQGYGISVQVNETNNNSYLLKITYTSFMIDQPMMGLTYDSETSTGETTGPAKALSSIIGASFNVEINDQGEVLEVSGLEAMLDSMASNMGYSDEAQATAFKDQMNAQYNAESIKSQMKRALTVYPDKELNIGDTWSADESITAPFPMNIQTTYELANFDDETVTLNISSDIFTEEGGEINANGATMTPDLSGVQSGTIVIDRSTGLLLSSNLEQLITGVMMLTSPAEMEIPMEISGTSIVKGSIN